MASSESVWVSVAISPSSISFLMTSGAESWSDSATSLTVEPERTGDRRVLLERRLGAAAAAPRDPAPPTADGAAAAPAARGLLRRRRLRSRRPPESRLRRADAGHPGRRRFGLAATLPRGRRTAAPSAPPAGTAATATGPGGTAARRRRRGRPHVGRRARRPGAWAAPGGGALEGCGDRCTLGSGTLDLALRCGRACDRGSGRLRLPSAALGLRLGLGGAGVVAPPGCAASPSPQARRVAVVSGGRLRGTLGGGLRLGLGLVPSPSPSQRPASRRPRPPPLPSPSWRFFVAERLRVSPSSMSSS